ncbi:MAG: phosphate butyryltransferase [Culturomica sp.]|jgi:phosphate butyryltransferase|nr:phosphate butyryltransferase [Culturomica sp.]
MKIERMNDLLEVLAAKSKKKRLVLACANENHSIEAVNKAVEMGIIEAILVGDEKIINEVCRENGYKLGNFKIINEPDDTIAVAESVDIIRKGDADILMKGLITSDKYMKAILNKEHGLTPQNSVISHVTVIENSHYHKLMIVSDVAVIPLPDLNQKIAMIKYVVSVARELGVEKPKVGLIAPSEQILPKVQSSVDATLLSKMAERGQLCSGAFVEGPLALDVAIDKESAEIKKVHSEVAGDADCLVFPNIESANVFYKANTKLGGGQIGAVIMGASAPCILSSRGDDSLSKLNSIALATLMANKQ